MDAMNQMFASYPRLFIQSQGAQQSSSVILLERGCTIITYLKIFE